MWTQLLALGVVAAADEAVDDRTAKGALQLATLFTASAFQNGYGRDHEDRADRVGLRYAYEAGFDVGRGPGLWERFARKYGDSGKVLSFFFSDHSQSSARARNLRREIAVDYPDVKVPAPDNPGRKALDKALGKARSRSSAR